MQKGSMKHLNSFYGALVVAGMIVACFVTSNLILLQRSSNTSRLWAEKCPATTSMQARSMEKTALSTDLLSPFVETNGGVDTATTAERLDPLVDFTFGTVLARHDIGNHTYRALRDIEFTFDGKLPATASDATKGPIRVCLVAAEPLSTTSVTFRLALLLARNQFQVTILTTYNNKDRDPMHTMATIQAAGIELVAAPNPPRSIQPNQEWIQASYRALEYFQQFETGLTTVFTSAGAAVAAVAVGAAVAAAASSPSASSASESSSTSTTPSRYYDIVHFTDTGGAALFPLVAHRQGWLLQKSSVVVSPSFGESSNSYYWKNVNAGGGGFASGSRYSKADQWSLDYFERTSLQLAPTLWTTSAYHARWLVSRGILKSSHSPSAIGFSHVKVLPTLPLLRPQQVVPELSSNPALTVNAHASVSQLVLVATTAPALALGLDTLATVHDKHNESFRVTALVLLVHESIKKNAQELLQKQKQRFANLSIEVTSFATPNQATEYLQGVAAQNDPKVASTASNLLVFLSSFSENPMAANVAETVVWECTQRHIPLVSLAAAGLEELVVEADRARCFVTAPFLPLNVAKAVSQRLLNNTACRPEWSSGAVSVENAVLAFHQKLYQQSQRPLPPKLSQSLSPHKQLKHRQLQTTTRRLKSSTALSEPTEKEVNAPQQQPNGTTPQIDVTVCLTHYERPSVLLAALEYWTKQTYYSHFEVIVVDDGSSSESTRHELDTTITAFLSKHGWRLLREQHGYLGASRNKCARQANPSSKWLFFFDDDDYPKSNALERMVQTAKHTKADMVTSIFHMFWGNSVQDLEKALARNEDWVWSFTGGSLTMGLKSNMYGGANLLVTKDAMARINGFSEFDRVGCEDYEFYVRAMSLGMRVELIPLPLVYISKKKGSMLDTMDVRLSEFRAVSPLYNRYPELADGLMMLKDILADERPPPPPPAVAGRRPLVTHRHFGDQGFFGWEFGYCSCKGGSTEGECKEGKLPHNCNFEPFLHYDAKLRQHHVSNRTGTAQPFVSVDNMHPFVGQGSMTKVSVGSLQGPISVVRRFKSFFSGTTDLSLTAFVPSQCGDGVWLTLLHGDTKLMQERINKGGQKVHWTGQVDLALHQHISVAVSPGETDSCDGTVVEFSADAPIDS